MQDWTLWNGGECPVKPDDIVYVRLRGEGPEMDNIIMNSPYKADEWDWSHNGSSMDIVSFKRDHEDA